MTNWDHVKDSHNRKLLQGLIKADRQSVYKALDKMYSENLNDSKLQDLPDTVFFYRCDLLSMAEKAFEERDIGLTMNRIKTFYLT